MNFSLGNNTQTGNYYYFEVEVGPKPESFESYMDRIFTAIGLRSDSSRKAYDKFTGRQSFFRYMVNNAKNNSAVAGALQNPQGKIIKITVQVSPSVIENLRRFGINLSSGVQGRTTFHGYAPVYEQNVKKYQNFTPAPETPVSQWTNSEKIGAVIKRAALLLPENVGKELLALLDPLALAVVGGVVVIWAASHFVGVGEIIDVVLLIVGIISIGPVAWKAGEHLINFAIGTVNAKKDEDLDEAANHLSEAIALLGVQVVMALLLKKAPKVFKEPRRLMNESVTPLTLKTVGTPPTTKGNLFYELPEIQIAKRHPYAAREVPGSTDQWGNSVVYPGRNSTIKDIELAKFHEEFHRLLTPKFQMFPHLRQIRAVIKNNSYLRSYILRYLEEALAQTTALLKTKGYKWENILEGVKYPVGEEGYVTIAKMRVEAKGILLGPIIVGGMIFNVYFSYNEDW